MSETTFVPVLLGSDVNVYGMARSFHEAYGLRSVAVAKGRLGATSNSRIVTVAVTEPRLEEDEVFVDTLIRFAGRHDNPFTRAISAPGLWLQRLTTREPDDSMIEVAIAAVKPVLPENPEDAKW